MANNSILSEFNPSDIAHFRKEFIQMVKVGSEIDRYWGEHRNDLDTYLPKFEKLVDKFNKKYKGVKIKTKKSIDSFKVRLFVKSRSVQEFFAESAAKIPGLKSVGKNNFGQIEVNDTDKFARFLDSMLDRAYLSYMDTESGTSTFIAVLDRKEKMIEIMANPAEIMNENSAAFKVFAYYALRDGFEKKTEIYGDASTFGFSNLLDEIEKREWYDKFNPRYLE